MANFNRAIFSLNNVLMGSIWLGKKNRAVFSENFLASTSRSRWEAFDRKLVKTSPLISFLQAINKLLHQSTTASTWWCGPRPRLGWVEMAVGLPEGPSYPGHSPTFFRYAAPWTTAEGQHTASTKSVACFHFFLSPALLRLLILLLLLMSGNVHPNPGPIFPCSVCAGNVTWRGKSVLCCTCSKWVHLRCSQLSLSKFRALGSSHSWSCLPCRSTVTPSSDSSDTYTSTVQSGPPSTDAALSRHPRLQTSYPPSAHYISPSSAPSPPTLAPGHFSTPPASSLPPDSLRVLQWNAGGLRATSTELLHFFLSHPVDLICIQESNLNSSSSFGFLGSLLCTLIAPLPVWHSLSWCHARQRRHHHFRQAGPILFWTFYLLSFFAWSLLWLCRDQHLS